MSPVNKPEDVIALATSVTPELAIPTDLAGKWYVAHTRSRNEKILAKGFTRLGIFHYLPLTQRVTRSPNTNRISRSLVPVFPGYLFFNGTEEQRYQTLRTNRVAHVLDVLNQDQLVAELRHVHFLLNHTNDFTVAKHLKVGDWGRIIAGPLAGLEGIITKYLSRLRLSMNVTILGQSVSIEVDSDNVERIDPPEIPSTTVKSYTRQR